MNRIFILFVLPLILFISCHKQPQTLNNIDIETLDFSNSPAILLDLAEYKKLNNSAITDSEAYYSYDLDTLRFGNTAFTSTKLLVRNEYAKVEELGDVFDANQSINRIEIYPSKDSTIDAILLEINDIEQAQSLLKDLDIKLKGTHQWTDHLANKTYLLHNDEWFVDDSKMLTVTLCIIKIDSKIGNNKLAGFFSDYYK